MRAEKALLRDIGGTCKPILSTHSPLQFLTRSAKLLFWSGTRALSNIDRSSQGGFDNVLMWIRFSYVCQNTTQDHNQYQSQGPWGPDMWHDYYWTVIATCKYMVVWVQQTVDQNSCASSMLLIYSSAPTHRMRYHYWVTNSRTLGERTHRIDNISFDIRMLLISCLKRRRVLYKHFVLQDLSCFAISMPLYLASRWQMRRTEGTRQTYRLCMS